MSAPNDASISGEQGSKGDRGQIGYGTEGRQGIVGPPGKYSQKPVDQYKLLKKIAPLVSSYKILNNEDPRMISKEHSSSLYGCCVNGRMYFKCIYKFQNKHLTYFCHE